MNKYLTLLALLACATVANAVCHTDAVDVSGTCYCKQGYWGTDASTTGDCAACTGNTDTDAPGATNTGAAIDVSACKKCVTAYFMTATAVAADAGATPAVVAAAATCSSCDTASTGSTNDGATGVTTAVGCNKCSANYYMTALANGSTAAQCTACPTKSTSAV